MSTIVKGNTPISTFKILWRVVISHAGFYQCRRCGQSKSAEEPWSPLLHRGPLRNSPATMTVLLYSLREHLAYYTHTLTSLSNSNFDLPETNTWGWVLLAERLWQRWPLKAWGPHSFLVEDADSQSVSQSGYCYSCNWLDRGYICTCFYGRLLQISSPKELLSPPTSLRPHLQRIVSVKTVSQVCAKLEQSLREPFLHQM